MIRFRNMVLAVFFAACALPGMLLSSQIMPLLKPVPQAVHITPVPLNTTPESQPIIREDQKWVVVAVSEDGSSQPQLAAVWGVFISFGDRSNLTFKEIYNPHAADTYGLASQFNLSQDGAVDPRFSSALKQMNVNWNGTILINESAATILRNWLERGLTNTEALSSTSLPQSICAFLTVPNVERPQTSLPWELLLSGGLKTDLPAAQFTGIGDQLLQASPAPFCEVISIP